MIVSSLPTLILACCLLASIHSLSGQAQTGKEQLKSDILEKGFVLGINLTNRGGGVYFHYIKGDARRQWVFGLDIHSVRDERETSIQSAFGDSGKDYIYGKLNYFYVFTPSVGIQKNLIPVGYGNLLNIRVGAQIGPAIGLLNPYLVEIFEPVNNSPNNGQGYRIVVPYDPTEYSYNEIIGKANLLSTKPSISAQLGLSLRGHILIDFTHSPQYIGGLSIGLNADYFPATIPIMNESSEQIENQQLFLAGSIGVVFGSRSQ